MERTPPPVDGPVTRAGFPVWSAELGPARVRFVGRGEGEESTGEEKPPAARGEVLATTEGRSIPVAGLRQVHSDRVVAAAEAGASGEGDALWTGRPGLALSVVTADCVPVVLAGEAVDGWRVAAVHAGWRGIVAGVVTRTVEALEVPPPGIRAWIGPAIGACCYEVGEEVARAVTAATGEERIVPPARAGADEPVRPHLDLVAAVRRQLESAGAPAPRVLLRCTQCDGERLWSYRREGEKAGRNHTFAWIEPRFSGQPVPP